MKEWELTDDELVEILWGDALAIAKASQRKLWEWLTKRCEYTSHIGDGDLQMYCDNCATELEAYFKEGG